jgi:hypothetical protein
MAIFLKRKQVLIYAFLFFSIPYTCWGQSISSIYKNIDAYTLNCNGNALKIDRMVLDWTWGDMGNTLSFNTIPKTVLSTGYLQNAYDPFGLLIEGEKWVAQIKIGPNPFKNCIHIYCNQDGMEILSIDLFTQESLCIYAEKGPFSGIQFEKTIPISHLTSGLYFVELKICVANKSIHQKIFKLIHQ